MNYKCDFCDKAFSQSANLKVNINNFHNKIKNYKCEFCDKAYTAYINLKYHITIVHYGLKKKLQM